MDDDVFNSLATIQLWGHKYTSNHDDLNENDFMYARQKQRVSKNKQL